SDTAPVAAVPDEAREVSAAIRTATTALRADADRRLRLLDSRAGGLMATALGVTWMIAIVTLALARLALVKIVQPVEALSAVASEIARSPSETTRRAPVSGDREIALLASDFNAMIDAIAARDAELRRMTVTDELTGMPNFRAFQERLQIELRRAERYAESFGLLVFDLDRFKKYNDEWGHLAGNEALAAVAKVVAANVRDSDLAARYGGEEFVAVVAQTDPAGLHRLAERIRAAVEALPPIANRAPLTCSIGGALFPADGTTPESLFEIADQRLYEAKEAGRNRVVVPSGGTVTPSA
ncbi:MAG: diguanylate cyclase, partial [Thermoanaerobaculia bacterium]